MLWNLISNLPNCCWRKGLHERTQRSRGACHRRYGPVGGAIAMRLAAEQATVAITSRDLSKAEGWAEQREGGKYIPAQLDLADEKSICNCLDYIQEKAGLPTILVANASLREGVGIPFESVTHTSFTRLFDVDIAGHILLLRNCLTRLTGQPASVVFLSSIYGRAGVDHRIYPPGMTPTPVQYTCGEGGGRRRNSLVGGCLGGARSASERIGRGRSSFQAEAVE